MFLRIFKLFGLSVPWLAVVAVLAYPYYQATDFPNFHQYEQQLRANITNILGSIDPE